MGSSRSWISCGSEGEENAGLNNVPPEWNLDAINGGYSGIKHGKDFQEAVHQLPSNSRHILMELGGKFARPIPHLLDPNESEAIGGHTPATNVFSALICKIPLFYPTTWLLTISIVNRNAFTSHWWTSRWRSTSASRLGDAIFDNLGSGWR